MVYELCIYKVFFFLILTELDLVKKCFHFGKEANFIVITSSQPNPFAYFTWGLVDAQSHSFSSIYDINWK